MSVSDTPSRHASEPNAPRRFEPRSRRPTDAGSRPHHRRPRRHHESDCEARCSGCRPRQGLCRRRVARVCTIARVQLTACLPIQRSAGAFSNPPACFRTPWCHRSHRPVAEWFDGTAVTPTGPSGGTASRIG